MAISSENSNGMVMPVAPMYGGNDGFGGFGGDGWWVILFLFALMGNWGGGFGTGGNNNMLPYYLANNTDNGVQRGFDTAAITGQLSGIQSAITSGFASSEIADCGRAMDAMQTAYTNQIASMNQRFADSQALTGQLNGLSMGLQNCCCENRASIADLKYTVATEACADRAAVSDALRDVLAANTASTQKILDQMCQDKIDSKNEKIAELQNQLNMAAFRESQVAQNAFITQGFTNEVDQLYNRLSNCPVPSVPVYGRQPIFTCNQNVGCGCGM